MPGAKYIPTKVNVDLHESLMQPDMARFLKNVVYDFADNSNSNNSEGGQVGVFKPPASNEKYIENLVLPVGYNHKIGDLSVKETKEIYVMVYNDAKNHTIYRLNGSNRTYDIVYQSPLLNFKLNPENFIHQGAAHLEVIYVTDPLSGEKMRRSFLFFTDGDDYQKCICVEDSIATDGFNENQFPYFRGIYDRSLLIRMGVPTPKDCIEISEIDPNTAITENNRLLFNTWQFRLLYTDVWGRPSEHGIISNMYIPGAGNCNPSSNNLARCLNLTFDAPPPHINSIQIEYRNCNSEVWKKYETLDLYDGSPIGNWWLRQRNPDVNYNVSLGKITYEFCGNKECEVIPTTETSRLQNPLPKSSESVAKIDKFIALSNNKDGFMPFFKELKDKIKIVVDAPDSQNLANNNLRNITVLVEIWNIRYGSEPIYRGEVTTGDFAYGFGAYGSPWQNRAFPFYQQYFKNRNQKGFVGYLAGTDAFTISTQYQLDELTGSFTEVSNFEKLDGAPIGGRKRYYQRFDFTNIPKGKYIFRLADHLSDPSVDKNYQKTSTYTWGLFPSRWREGFNPQSPPISDDKELVIDVCDKNYDSREDNKILTVIDTTDLAQTVEKGYVKNTDESDEFQVGVELMQVSAAASGTTKIIRYTNRTDHNGFYWILAATPSGLNLFRFTYKIYGMCGCRFGEQFSARSGTGDQVYTTNYFMNKSNCRDYSSQTCNYIKITGKVKGCGTTYGIPNVGVVLSRGMSTRTDENGEFTIIAHDDVVAGARLDSIYFITNSCGFTDCNDDCIEPYEITIQPCVSCMDRIITVPDRFVLYFDIVRGLRSDGVYPVGVVGFDWLGRATFVQPLGNIKIPSFQQTKVFAPSTISVDIDPTAFFPEEIEYITFWMGEETTTEDYITWVVDDVQFIDNTGLVNEISPTQIKIYLGSMMEYNKQNNFATTTNWGFLATDNNEPLTGDRIEFLLNGNGEFFGKYITGLVKYDQTGQYVLIDYTTDLKNLRSNALIRLVRPKVCTGIEPYFEIPCSTVNIVNRHAQVLKFQLNAYDTYYQKRQIPVPVLQTPANPNATPPTVDIFANELRILGTPFEHKSVSDFWGKNCWNAGRVNSKNPYETELYHRDQIALSGAISDTGQLNYLHYFDNAKKISFDENNGKGIVSVLPKTGMVLVICQQNNFIVGFNDNLVRQKRDGTLGAGSADDGFGKPQMTAAANYGCLIADKNTIYEKDGLVHFLDATKSWLIQNNYQHSYPISINGADGHLRPKIKYVQQFNNTHESKRYFVGVTNPAGNEYLLTDYTIRSLSTVNQLRQFDITAQETLSFGTLSKMFKGSYSFTPEGYSELEGEINDQQMISFVRGIPYMHYKTAINKTYNNFYGIQCESIFEIVVVIDNMKKKRPLSIGEYCKQGVFFADRVITETDQESRILIAHWKQADFGFYAPFLCDINTLADSNLPQQTGVNKLTDGTQLRGTWIKVRLVSEPTLSTKYFEFQGITCEVFGVEKSGV